MNLTRFKLRNILLSGFGIIITCTLTLVIFLIIQMNKLADLNNEMFNHPLKVSNAVRDIEINIYALNRTMKDVLLVENIDELSNSIVEIDSLKNNVLELYTIVQKQFLGNPKDVEDAYQFFLEWDTIWNEIVLDIQNDTRKKALITVRTKGNVYFSEMISKTDIMIEYANNKAISFFENSKKIRHSINILVIILSLSLVILSIAIALIITKSITNPINKIIRKIIVISKKYFNTEINFAGNHHLTLLDKSVDKLEELSNELLKGLQEKEKAQAELKESQNALIYLLEDVNDIKSDLEKTVIQLRSSQKEMESFVYSISHDLRAPLRSIMGFSEIISKRYKADLNDEGIEYFGYILEASINMANLIEDLLKYSRLAKDPIEKDMVNLNEVIENVLKNLNHDITEHNSSFVIPDYLPIVKGNNSLFSQIFSNLIQNSIIYHRDGINPEISISVFESKVDFTIRIKDNGQGIPKEHFEKIFNIFQRLHSNEEYPGTGIGLAIVKKAVRALGGSILLESETGKGTTFIIKLPKD